MSICPYVSKQMEIATVIINNWNVKSSAVLNLWWFREGGVVCKLSIVNLILMPKKNFRLVHKCIWFPYLGWLTAVCSLKSNTDFWGWWSKWYSKRCAPWWTGQLGWSHRGSSEPTQRKEWPGPSSLASSGCDLPPCGSGRWQELSHTEGACCGGAWLHPSQNFASRVNVPLTLPPCYTTGWNYQGGAPLLI